MKCHKVLSPKVLLAMIVALAVIGCNQQARARLPNPDAVAVLIPTLGNEVSGVVTFYRTGSGTRIIADIAGVSPGGHGFHIHEFGDCSSDDGASAGGHFNPHNKPHGSPDVQHRHVGDLGNAVADENGVIALDISLAGLTLTGENGILGRGVVVHADEDDFKTQPHGAAGKRLACGVIGLAHRR